jgi:hypothetical protein
MAWAVGRVAAVVQTILIVLTVSCLPIAADHPRIANSTERVTAEALIAVSRVTRGYEFLCIDHVLKDHRHLVKNPEDC